MCSLPTGNIVVVDAGFNSNAGAVYLYNGATRALISRLIGGNPDDQVGSGGITVLPNGNFVVNSSNWNGDRGAATWGSGLSGIMGAVSSANSLVGSTAGDQVSSDLIRALYSGNYVVQSSGWNGSVGAATWGSGITGVTGEVSSSNSLVGSTANDQVGSNVAAFSSGNYVVQGLNWSNGRSSLKASSKTLPDPKLCVGRLANARRCHSGMSSGHPGV